MNGILQKQKGLSFAADSDHVQALAEASLLNKDDLTGPLKLEIFDSLYKELNTIKKLMKPSIMAKYGPKEGPTSEVTDQLGEKNNILSPWGSPKAAEPKDQVDTDISKAHKKFKRFLIKLIETVFNKSPCVRKIYERQDETVVLKRKINNFRMGRGEDDGEGESSYGALMF